jgi:hypothetical protein
MWMNGEFACRLILNLTFVRRKERASGSSGRRGGGPDGHDPLASSRLIRATLLVPLDHLLPKTHPILRDGNLRYAEKLKRLHYERWE